MFYGEDYGNPIKDMEHRIANKEDEYRFLVGKRDFPVPVQILFVIALVF
jgi:hypothetical protein